MRPLVHVLIGGIFSAFLFILFPEINLIEAMLVFSSSFLLDIDHYLYYIHHKKDFSLKNAYGWFIQRISKLEKLPTKKQGEYKRIILFFHGIEFWVVLIFLSFYAPFISFLLLGTMAHIFIDMVEDFRNKTWVLGKLSQTYVYLKDKNKKEFKF